MLKLSLSHGILGFLLYGNMSGYDLAKIFDSSVKFFWYARANHIYLELTKLEKKSYVKCEYIVQRDKPNKKLYHITDEGKNEFLRWISTNNDDIEKNKNAFLMRVFFSGSTTVEQSIDMFNKFIDDCTQYIDSMDKVPSSINEYSKFVNPMQSLYWKFTSDYGLRLMKMNISWAKDCIKQINNMK